MWLRSNSSKVLAILIAGTVSVGGNAFAESFDDQLNASMNLKKAHVLRYYERCISDGRQDAECRSELEALHPRELAALQKMLRNANRYDQLEAGGALAACYDVTNDYKELIECWERLSVQMAAGETIQGVRDKLPPPSDYISSKLSGLSSTEKISVVICVRGAVSNNYRDTVARNLKAGGGDVTWALKVNAIENSQMSALAQAADWTEMEMYYKAEADSIELLIQGKVNFESYQSSAHKNKIVLKDILEVEGTRQDAHEKNFRKFESICTEISSTIIGKAKAIASK